MNLKKISDQTIVITGATSGIGLTTARRAAKAGAKVVLVARNEDALRDLAAELNQGGGNTAIYYATDVADEAALRGVAAAAMEAYGGFDTWVNNAGASIYGKIEDNTDEDMRRLFETNFWGLVYGSRVAAQFLKSNGGGGAIINVGSVLSDRAIALQGIYSASKHAVKGFTDAFRMELEMDKAPISVTLIKPSAINTPYAMHAKNYTDKEATLPPPVFAPDLVAEAILHCAETGERDFTVGEGKILASLGSMMPRTTDLIMERGMAQQSFKNEPKINRPDGLHQSNSNLSERGNVDGMVFEESIMQRAKLNPVVTGTLLVGGAAAVTALLIRRSRRRRPRLDTARYYEADQYNFSEQTEESNERELNRDNEREMMQVGHS